MRILFWIILLIGILFRVIFFIHSLNVMPISTDEACIGLMAKHIIHGEFPLIYWGVGYHGPLDSYLNVPIFLFLAPSPFSMRILTFVGSILFLILVYILGKNMFGEKVGLISMLFAAIPPAYLVMAGVLAISPYNYYILAAGTLILILAHRLIYSDIKESKRIIYFAVLGFLSGIIFWMHMIIVCYLITVVVFLFLKDKLFFIKKGPIISFIFFCIGSLPFWIYNFSHHFGSFALGRSVPVSTMLGKLKILFSFTLPAIVGFHVPLYIDSENFIHLPLIAGLLYGIVLIVSFVYIFIVSIRGILRVLVLSLKKTSGMHMLLFFILVIFFLFVKIERTNSWSLRYIEPIFSVFPILLGFAAYRLARYSRILAVIFGGIILFVNLYGGIKIYEAWSDKKTVEETLELPDTASLIGFFKREGIDRVFANNWLAYRITFETNEEIIASPAYDERFGQYTPPYLKDVERSPNPAYVFYRSLGIPQSRQFEGWLIKIGGEYRKKEIEGFTVFYSFRSPCGEFEEEEIPRDNWIVDVNFKKEDAHYAIDGDLITRWGSGAPQSPGMYFLIDLGRHYRICRIRFDMGRFVSDMPRAYKVEVSLDKETWKVVLENKGDCNLFWEGNQPRFAFADYFNICFKPVPAEFIKITQTGQDPRCDWSITEIKVYGADTK